MATVLEELLIKVGIETDEKSVQSFTQTSKEAADVLKKLAITAAAAAGAMVAYTLKMGNATDAQAKFSRSSGIALSTLQELEFAAQREGASAGELTGVLQGLNVAIGQLAVGKGPQEAIRRLGGLGITFDELQSGALTADKLLLRIADSIKDLPRPRQVELTGALGINQNVLQLLQQGRFSIQELREEARKLGLVDIETSRRAEALNDQLTNAKQKLSFALLPLRLMITEMAVKLIPKITDWIDRNKELIPQLTKFAVVLVGVFAAGKVLMWVAAVGKATKAVFGLAGAFKALGIAKGAAGIAGAVGGGGTVAGGVAAGGAAAAAGGGAILPVLLAALGVAGVGIIGKKIYDQFKDQQGAPIFESRKSTRVIGSQSRNISQRFEFNISGSQSPEQTAKAVRRELTNVLRAELPNVQAGIV